MIDLGAEGRGLAGTLRDGFLIWKLAPLVPLIAVVPEFVQHCAEISLGMFSSLEAFRALSMDPTRMAFGGIKIAGLLIAILMTARFWANRETGARWWSMAGVGWKQVLIGLAVQVALALPMMPDYRFDPMIKAAVSAVLTVASLPALVLMIGGIVGDRETGLADAYRHGWSRALRIALYFVPAWAVMQPLHRLHHMAALGRPAGLVWGLMGWDALVVGLMATMGGAALYQGYRRQQNLAETL